MTLRVFSNYSVQFATHQFRCISALDVSFRRISAGKNVNTIITLSGDVRPREP
jgi:hypothetical protein